MRLFLVRVHAFMKKLRFQCYILKTLAADGIVQGEATSRRRARSREVCTRLPLYPTVHLFVPLHLTQTERVKILLELERRVESEPYSPSAWSNTFLTATCNSRSD